MGTIRCLSIVVTKKAVDFLEKADRMLPTMNANFFELKGKTITSIVGINPNDEQTVITTSDGTVYTLEHYQDCCEDVRVYNTVGKIDDVLNEEVIVAEDDNPMDNPNAIGYVVDSCKTNTWTNFRIVTNKGAFEIWWLGESRGYSEDVSVSKNK